ncbi:hypothetical protein tpqmel_0860, partial [Candidatus Gastranaerophilus sp. (ex Termes propinquus)]
MKDRRYAELNLQYQGQMSNITGQYNGQGQLDAQA